MSYEHIHLAIEEGIATLTLDQPRTMNAMSVPLQKEVRNALANLKGDREVKALILTGTGKAFCSGADLGSMSPDSDGPSLGTQVKSLMEELSNPLALELRDLPFPVVSAVNGAAAGAGASIALAADIVVAGKSAYFLFPFIPKLGILPDLGATWILPRLIGRARAMAVSLLGERIYGPEAVDQGLIWKCVADDQLQAEVLAVARRLTSGPNHAAPALREAFDQAETATLVRQLAYEADRQQELIDSPTFQEGVRAFLEKREPNF
ncbi:2-(1,2-epoxy-1,2-dihydrophenyl)acetyl-CoA isomerase [Marinobacter daqiaonensis]|uniref:2-(1,2-epoxy-1,2-dihydrophenyl)acetyl-CoA isomerase n=1 Tax=Marinobacter daqiaonensis TaxID=650891 RepID=A0A1I6INY0_9GAMM|nr:enoyl-CoA hydratase-related protein [Marinobacter daqiaonensis]SFR68319.1 2-(1,2-epoxy-1,2-dihydrophenyl)acetyl-CoA isomerase [Marinobacter daqiaonensis]